MRVLVTGSTGLVGKAVIAAALRAGHQVTAMIRPASCTAFELEDATRLQRVSCDLRDPRGLGDIVANSDAVIHAAALKSGDLTSQFAVTVRGTEHLLENMAAAPGRRLVAVSSMSVYDFAALSQNELVSPQTTPLIEDSRQRDDYARAKLFQERLTTAAHHDRVADVVTVRPGYIIGPGEHPWHPLLGTWVGDRFVAVGRTTRPPLAYVDNVAEAMVAAVTADCGGAILDIVDDHLPTNAEYVDRVLARADLDRPVFVPWPVMRGLGSAVNTVARKVLGEQAKLPGIFIPAKVHARFKPLLFTNAPAQAELGWSPQVGLDTALDRVTASPSEMLTPA